MDRRRKFHPKVSVIHESRWRSGTMSHRKRGLGVLIPGSGGGGDLGSRLLGLRGLGAGLLGLGGRNFWV